MKFSFVSGNIQNLRSHVLFYPLFEEQLSDKKKTPEVLRELDTSVDGLLLEACKEEGFQAKAEQVFMFHPHRRVGVQRILLLGLGKKSHFKVETLRLAAGKGIKAAQKLKASEAIFMMPEEGNLEDVARAVVEGLGLGQYKFDRYRTSSGDEKATPGLRSVQLVLPPKAKKDKALEETLQLALEVVEATNWARDLVNEPAEIVTPTELANHAQALAKKTGLHIRIGGRKDIEKLKMGMFLGVARGSVEEPKLIHLTYTPKNPAHAKRAPVVLVGKAITFDSGGLSLKPADGMVDMKTDMAGSAAVLGAMQVISLLKPPFPVHGMMGACENMPSGHAYRPGDILVSRAGKTVEITNTDAEGRLVLGDILTYASEMKPAIIIDLATLTGACMVALGNYLVGTFGDDDQAVSDVLQAAETAGENLWRLPIFELQKDALRSDVADMKNSGERWGGAINAAVFLKEFVGQTPWVHLDIAGPSQSPKERGYYAKGATGVGVRTLVEFVRQKAAQG